MSHPEGPARPGKRGIIVTALAVGSGIAGLGYQVIWAEQFGLLLGSTQVAVAAVLAAFMLGLTVGSAVIGRLSVRLARPLRWYAAAELAIALSALAMRTGLGLVDGAVAPLLGAGLDGTAASAGAATGLYIVAAAALMLVPTVAMGATLPLLVEGTRGERDSATIASGLYSANTLGAALGALFTALVLLPAVGLAEGIYLMAALNVIVAAVAFLIDRPRVVPSQAAAAEAPPLVRTPIVLVGMAGVASFIYEIFWTRVLVHHLGADVYAFGAMLAVLLLGIAIGAVLVRRFPPRRPGLAFALAQVWLAVAALISFKLMTVVVAPSMAQVAFWALIGERLLYVSLLLMPPAILIGVSLPLALFWLQQDHDHGGRGVGIAYAANTLGAIVGSLAGALWILPGLGFSGALWLGVAGNLSLGLVAWVASGRPEARRFAVSAFAITGALILFPPVTPDALYRTTPLSQDPSRGDLAYAQVGRTSTVALVDQVTGWRLLTNGLPESMIQRRGENPGNFDVSHWLSLLPVTLNPEARSMMVVGLGGGGTVEDIVDSIDTIDVVELEPEVLAANQRVANLRRFDPLSDSRVTVHLNDARMELKRSARQFDLIVAQPSHTWTSGASHLYTREYFELVRDRLDESGVFSQWIGLQFVDQPLILALLHTLQDVFGHVQAYSPKVQSALIFVASRSPLSDLPSAGFERFERDWQRLGTDNIEELLAARVLDESGVAALARSGEMITDYNNLLKYAAPRILGRPAGRSGMLEVVAPFDAARDLDRYVEQVDSGRLLRQLMENAPSRARLFAGDTASRLALVDTWQPADPKQRARLNPALNDPTVAEQAVAILFLRFQDGLMAGEELPNVRRWLRDDVERPLLDVLVAMASGRVDEVATRREWLQQTFPPGSPYHRLAVQTQAQAALALDDQVWVEDLFSNHRAALEGSVGLRFEMAMAAGREMAAVAALFQWTQSLGGKPPGAALKKAVARCAQLGPTARADPRLVLATQVVQGSKP